MKPSKLQGKYFLKGKAEDNFKWTFPQGKLMDLERESAGTFSL